MQNDEMFLIGDGLLGRVLDAHGVPQDDRGPLTSTWRRFGLGAPPAGAAHRRWETGIKVIDFYAPIPLGGVVALVAGPGVGLIVTIAELTHRIARQTGGCTVIAHLDDEAYPAAEMIGGLREAGVEAHATLLVGIAAAAPDERGQLTAAALAAAEDFCARGRDVLLVLDDGLLTAETAELLRGRAHATEHGSLTLLLCFWRHTTSAPKLAQGADELLRHADATLVFSRELAAQAIYPAIDALASRSRLLDENLVDAAHLHAAARAREVLRKGGERGLRLRLFQSQPYFVAEPYTGMPGVSVDLAESLRDFTALTAGMYDHIPAQQLRFQGTLGRP
jgi:F-type H+/Na+-transporting ATPase subunit beta